MLTLTIRTDKPEAEIGLFDNSKQLAHKTWQADRKLAETIHKQIVTLLKSIGKEWPDIKAVVIYQGPGSFTGLRIGMSVANALAYGYALPIVTETSEDWINLGLKRLSQGESDSMAKPAYGSPIFTTQPKS